METHNGVKARTGVSVIRHESSYIRGYILGALRHDLAWLRICIRLDLEHNGRVTDARVEIRRFQEQLMLARLTPREKAWLRGASPAWHGK